jgi:hypothetical protein
MSRGKNESAGVISPWGGNMRPVGGAGKEENDVGHGIKPMRNSGNEVDSTQ